MKLAFLVSRFPVLSETFVLNQIAGMLELGHSVDIIAGEPDIGVEFPEILEPNRHNLRFIYHATSQSRLVGLAQGFVRCLRLLPRSPRMVFKAFRPRYHVLGPSFAIFPVVDSITKSGHTTPIEYDAIVAHFGPNGLLATGLIDLGLIRGPLATIFHGFDVTSIPKSFGDGFYRYLFRRGDLFLPVSELWRTRLLNLGCPGDKTMVHRVGIDCNSFEPRKIVNKPQNLKLRLLSVARLVEKKGIKISIEAVRQLVDDGMQISYRIAGDGPLMRELQNQVKRLALEPNITFLGQVPNSKIRDELSGTDLLIAPSVTAANGDMEGIPVTIMEAMAMEIPVVSTRHSGIPELIEDGVTGYLAQEGDIQSLYQKVKQASEENDKWPALGGSARTRILEDFNSRIQNRKLTELLKTIRERDDC